MSWPFVVFIYTLQFNLRVETVLNFVEDRTANDITYIMRNFARIRKHKIVIFLQTMLLYCTVRHITIQKFIEAIIYWEF